MVSLGTKVIVASLGTREMVSLGMKVMVSRQIKYVQTNDHSFEST